MNVQIVDIERRSKRKGVEGVNRRVIMEFIGALALIIIFALVIAHFLGTFVGCWADEDCMQCREEVNRLADSVDEVCQQSTMELTDEAEELPGGEYDFSCADFLHISPDGEFTVGSLRSPGDIMEDLGDAVLSLFRALFSLDPTEFTREWSVSQTADTCERTDLCVTGEDVENCGDGRFDILDGTTIPFFLTETDTYDFYLIEVTREDTFTYVTPDERQVNIKYEGLEIEWSILDALEDDVYTCGGDSHFCHDGNECPMATQHSPEYDDQCDQNDGDDICCISAG